jgi:predicted nucleic acid-binding protein
VRQKFVFDATPLIHMAKAGLAPLLVDLAGEKFTVPAVVDEVVGRAKEYGLEHPDAGIISSLIDEGALLVRKPPREGAAKVAGLHRDIHRGEAEVLALAKALKAMAVVDDRAARSAARIQGVRLEGTYGVVLRAVRRGSVTSREAEEHLGRLVSSGWRCDAELYAALLRALRNVGPGKGA